MAKVELESVVVEDNQEAGRFEARDGEALVGLAEYRLNGDEVIFTHTEVPEALEGQGIGGKLVRSALDDVRARGLKAVPMCRYVLAYVRRHGEYRDLVPPERARELGL